MSAKQTTKAAEQAPAAEQKPAVPPPQPRAAVQVRVKTKSPGIKRQVCGVIFENTWKYLTLDELGSAYKAIDRDPALTMEKATPPAKPAATDEPGKEAK